MGREAEARPLRHAGRAWAEVMVESREPRVESADSCRKKFDTEGFFFARAFFSVSEVEELREVLTPLLKNARAGVRNLLRRSSAVAELAKSDRILTLLSELAGAAPFPVRGILFDKTPEANWRVSWHQDLTIALSARAELAGFGPWSVKEGVVHAQAPVSLLERMLIVRIHLDDADKANAALQVIPASHRSGKLDDAAIDRIVATDTIRLCETQAGDILVMRPLLLHASSPAIIAKHRRVIHLEYATDDLPSPVEWFERSR